MKKAEIAQLKEKLQQENPKASAEELDNLLAEAIAEAEKNSTLFDGDGGSDMSDLEKARAELEEERTRLEKERAELEKEKAQLAAEKAGNAADQPPPPDAGESRTYKCVTPCTFGGRYYREGETLIITDGSKPTDYFEMI